VKETHQWLEIYGYREATISAYRKFSGARGWRANICLL
jgi:hypothetical protein